MLAVPKWKIIMLNFTLDAIRDHLKTRDFVLQYQPETDQLFTNLKYQNVEFPFFLRIYEGNELLQLIAFMPFPYIAEYSGELARLLHYINKEIDLPGYGMDEKNNIIFYRIMLPVIDQQLNEKQLDLILETIPSVCQAFAEPIILVGQGKETFASAVKKIGLQIHE